MLNIICVNLFKYKYSPSGDKDVVNAAMQQVVVYLDVAFCSKSLSSVTSPLVKVTMLIIPS